VNSPAALYFGPGVSGTTARRAPAAAFLLVLVCSATAVLGAQDKKGPELRTVHGVVVDKDGKPLADSVVYLMNIKTQAVRTYITDATGSYHFSGLDPYLDYEVRAEKDDLASAARTVSSFDSRRDIDVALKLDRKRPSH
jgi:protocatechuate 3,4-dioxygenase beta subunit